ncbi:hypothetical protein O988_08780, partial [Pseudogymnoascus sp. VKM F-3808]
AGEAGEAGSTTKVCARQRRRLGNGGNGSGDNDTGDAGTANVGKGDEQTLALVAKDEEEDDENGKERGDEGEKEVCCGQKEFDGARRAGLIDAVAWEVVEHGVGGVGSGFGAGVGVGRKLPLDSSRLTLMCRPRCNRPIH